MDLAPLRDQVVQCGIEVNQPWIGGMEPFLSTVQRWGMPWTSDGVRETASYLHKLHHGSYFATALQVSLREPFLGMMNGTLILVSTTASTQQKQVNVETVANGGIVTEPYWMKFDVWWYYDIALGNLAGVTDRKYRGTKLHENLGMLVEKGCRQRGIESWEDRYLIYDDNPICARHNNDMHGLRMFICEVMVNPVWMEFTFGLSSVQFRALDMCMSTMTSESTMTSRPLPRELSTWYLLNTYDWPLNRPIAKPKDWYCHVHHMIAMGQRERRTYTNDTYLLGYGTMRRHGVL